MPNENIAMNHLKVPSTFAYFLVAVTTPICAAPPFTYYQADTNVASYGGIYCVGDCSNNITDPNNVYSDRRSTSSGRIESIDGGSYSITSGASSVSDLSVGTYPDIAGSIYSQVVTAHISLDVHGDTIHAQVSSVAVRSAYGLCLSSMCVYNEGRAGGAASASAGWVDTITFQTLDNSVDTPIVIQFGVYMHSIVGATPSLNKNNLALINLDASLGVSGGSWNLTHTADSGQEWMGDTRTFSVLSGRTYGISAGMILNAQTFVGIDQYGVTGDNASVGLDAGDTAFTTVNILTSGASYRTASNTVFLSGIPVLPAVPEPNTLWLLLAGLSVLPALRKKSGSLKSACV